MDNLQKYFHPFRQNIVGIDQHFESPYGTKRIVYADWTASGRLYAPIENKISNDFGPFVANTHTESCITGTAMTSAYRKAHQIIKQHVNAGPHDVIINAGYGMTAAINKFQRILGLKVPEQCFSFICEHKTTKPIVFLSHMEHHSNHTSWLTTIADIEVIRPDADGLVDLDDLEKKLKKHKNRPIKIGSFTAGSNVTGIQPPFHKMANIMHQYDGFCFVDYAAAAPYVAINMHPENPEEKLDAVFFSPHKFLGGPGSSGVLIFDSHLYHNRFPDHPGGGTVEYTNPWGNHKFTDNIEVREDGGTPGFLQTIKAALAIKLKEQMTVDKILSREEQLLKIAFSELEKIPNLIILADHIQHRMGIISFYIKNTHYNLVVKLLNDRFGIQVRGGCSCAGTYGHYLLHVGPQKSKRITEKIDHGDLSEKPGWVRMSFHPTTTDEEMYFITDAVRQIAQNAKEWEKDYTYSSQTNEYHHIKSDPYQENMLKNWFSL